jgi:hypothetical protein
MTKPNENKTMQKIAFGLLIVICLPGSVTKLEASEIYVSTEEQVTLVELYTSEGCSSCPAADRWLTGLKDPDNLWKKYIPLAFHVDYWNKLGWPDRFSDHSYSVRQASHQIQDNVQSVYTPEFVINGGEWRGFFNPDMRNEPITQSILKPGRLLLTHNDGKAMVQFDRLLYPEEIPIVANLAYLGTNLKTNILRGENAGRELHHNFVVLKMQSQENPGSVWKFDLDVPEAATAVVAWLSFPSNLSPLQAVGGYLSDKP